MASVGVKECKEGCGKLLIYDSSLPKPPFAEADSGIHHTYKRCAELLKENKNKNKKKLGSSMASSP